MTTSVFRSSTGIRLFLREHRVVVRRLACRPGPGVEALILIAMTFVFLLAARWMLRKLERMARKEGRLSVRWQ